MKLTKRQNEIVNSSIEIIAEEGIQRLTMKNIAGKLGISDAALYRHFSGKDDILKAVLNQFQAISDTTDLESKPMSSLEKIKMFLKHRYNIFSQNPPLAKIMFSEEIFRSNPELGMRMKKIMHSHFKNMEKILEEGQNSNEINPNVSKKALFRIIVGSMRLLVNQWCLSDYVFDLKLEGKDLWQNIKKIIQTK